MCFFSSLGFAVLLAFLCSSVHLVCVWFGYLACISIVFFYDKNYCYLAYYFLFPVDVTIQVLFVMPLLHVYIFIYTKILEVNLFAFAYGQTTTLALLHSTTSRVHMNCIYLFIYVIQL